MRTTRKISDNIYYLGANDRRIALFENLFPLNNGISYNSYFIDDEKTAVTDTVDRFVSDSFFENLAQLLNGRPLDYLIVHHMEPDHAANIGRLIEMYPDMQVVCSLKANQMIKQFFGADLGDRAIIVQDGDSLSLGKHKLHFVTAPMVHWPEVIMSWEESTGILFSADAFGAFGALDGRIFNDEILIDESWWSEARRYYANIVGKYGVQVQAVLKKADALDVKMIAPLHGPVWRSNVADFIAKYDLWSRYQPEEKGVLIAYASMYGNTEAAANALALALADRGVDKIRLRDVSVTDVSELISLAWKYSNIVIAAPTYNGNMHPKMEHFVMDMKHLNLQNRGVSIIENGSWGPAVIRKASEILESMKNMRILEQKISIKSALHDLEPIEKMADEIAADLKN
ncbi:MAG: FprA family A-type flavoprotein [Oscillospiraceae bacterium]|nr:FprA family A-type flavoprotein [Oscillospiraceae bacterium]